MATVQERHPRLFAPSTNIDRRKGKRVVPMQVLNMSFPRTGMQTALHILGYRCYHSSEFFANIKDCQMWDEALDAKFSNKGTAFTRNDWDRLLGEYSGVSADPPPVAFAEDLIAAYPEAKVILVERDIEAWYKSFATIIDMIWSPWTHVVASLDPFWLGPMRDTHMRWVTGWMGARSKAHMQDLARPKYREHYRRIRMITPKERLLEFQLAEGWGPLCRFLGKDEPNCPFPRVNDNAAVQEQMKLTMQRGCWNALQRLLSSVLLVAIATVAWWWMR